MKLLSQFQLCPNERDIWPQKCASQDIIKNEVFGISSNQNDLASVALNFCEVNLAV